MFQNNSFWTVKSAREFFAAFLITIGLVLVIGGTVVAADAQSRKPLRILLINSFRIGIDSNR